MHALRTSASIALVAAIAAAASAQAGSSGGIADSAGHGSGGSTAGHSGNAPGPLRWETQRATWYGPGFFGNQTACGQTLTRRTVGVAHRTLPCGSKVVLRYEGRVLRTRVIDRGPFANGARWDLTQAAARKLGFEYTDEIDVAKLGT